MEYVVVVEFLGRCGSVESPRVRLVEAPLERLPSADDDSATPVTESAVLEAPSNSTAPELDFVLLEIGRSAAASLLMQSLGVRITQQGDRKQCEGGVSKNRLIRPMTLTVKRDLF